MNVEKEVLKEKQPTTHAALTSSSLGGLESPGTTPGRSVQSPRAWVRGHRCTEPALGRGGAGAGAGAGAGGGEGGGGEVVGEVVVVMAMTWGRRRVVRGWEGGCY